MRSIEIAAAALALGATACGNGASGTAKDARALATYQGVGQQMSTAIASYAADTSAMPDVSACDVAHGRYQAAMPGLVERMQEMSAAMDARMAEVGHSGFDTRCMADAMHAELERHHAAACASADVAVDRREATGHAAAMSRWMEHQRIRYQEAGSSMGMMGAPDGTTFTCVENADGTFSIDGVTWSPGSGAPGTGDCQTCECLGTCPPGTDPWPAPCPDGSCCGGGMGGHP